jgi:hypothetical protein
VAFDGADGKVQTIGDLAVGQSLGQHRDDLALPCRERQRFGGLPKRVRHCPAALLGQRLRAGGVGESRSTLALTAISQRGVGS